MLQLFRRGRRKSKKKEGPRLSTLAITVFFPPAEEPSLPNPSPRCQARDHHPLIKIKRWQTLEDSPRHFHNPRAPKGRSPLPRPSPHAPTPLVPYTAPAPNERWPPIYIHNYSALPPPPPPPVSPGLAEGWG